MRRFLISLVTLTALSGTMVSVSADDIEDAGDGWIAYESGDYGRALTLFRKAAEQGNAKAQLSLGVIYENGQGVLQDFISAHMWMNIAATNGSEEAVENRHNVANKMTYADISEAQRRAKICLESDYQNCD